MTISRQTKDATDITDWANCDSDFNRIKLHVAADGLIEDGVGLLQVDFANKFLGGGVLGLGCVQEEIRFVINPELLVTRLFVEMMQPNEAIFFIGSERFCKFTGYATNFKFDGNLLSLLVLICLFILALVGEFIDKTPRDKSRRRLCDIVAINATKFFRPAEQFRDFLMQRELNKVRCRGEEDKVKWRTFPSYDMIGLGIAQILVGHTDMVYDLPVNLSM